MICVENIETIGTENKQTNHSMLQSKEKTLKTVELNKTLFTKSVKRSGAFYYTRRLDTIVTYTQW